VYSFDYKSSALPTELNWLFPERKAESDVFPNKHQAFSVFNSVKPYAEIGRDRQRYEPKVGPKVVLLKLTFLSTVLFYYFFKIFKNLNKQSKKHLIICLTVYTVSTILTSVDGSKARHKTQI
jgi:hypothetical protein